jgi:hypothetical protein
VSHANPVGPACAEYGSLVDSEDDGFSARQRDNVDAGLHARPLLRQDELATLEVLAGLCQEEGGLQGKDVLSIKVLVQAVIVALAIPQQQGCRSGLAGRVAAVQVI